MLASVPLLALSAAAASTTLGLRISPAQSVLHSRYVHRSALRMESTPRSEAGKKESPTLYEEYIKERVERGEDLELAYSDLGQDIDFDGGDSGSGAVGDGKMTLDDQHNSPYIVGSGSLRDAVEGAANAAVTGEENIVKGAVSARDMKQKNYWGRQVGTGYADTLEKDERYAERPVLRQQLENWQNQQNLKSATDSVVESQTNFYGQVADDAATRYRKDMGRPIDSMRSEIVVEGVGSAQRLDGEDWGEVQVAPSDEVTEQFELFATPNSPGVLDISVLNELSNFAPFRVAFTPDSPSSMTVTPTEGVMEKRASGKTTDLVVRFAPEAYGIPVIGTLVFETEDFKNVFKVVGMTAR